ncbi:MAG: hypothetical protein CMJ39_11535 [Phycisphaerae bacterium]|nr:hypothetical protein [Phycisphaerae bacterium]|tara:strand:+ start:687 stop:1676 length:990 start_codon:yes stop_codon:yes gene_type:complete
MLLGFLATASVASTTAAEVFSVIYGEPDFDRWMYPYNGTPGTRIAGPTFGGPYAEIDDRYGQSFCGFVTVDIPVDLPPSAYRVISMSMDIPIINDVVIYDPTPDALETHYSDGPPDEDPGRPFHLSGAGFRGDFNATTFGEDGPGPFGFGLSQRNVYPVAFDETEGWIDISNNLSEGFDPKLFAIGECPDVAPGDPIPELTRVVFDIDVEDPNISCYLSEALSFGTIDLVLSSYQTGSHDGGNYPQWLMKEHPLVDIGATTGATLTLEVEVIEPSGVSGDTNGDAAVNVDDLLNVLGDYGSCPCCPTDFDGDGAVTVDDVLAVIGGWTG